MPSVVYSLFLNNTDLNYESFFQRHEFFTSFFHFTTGVFTPVLHDMVG